MKEATNSWVASHADAQTGWRTWCVSKTDLINWLNNPTVPPIAADEPMRQASEEAIRTEIRAVYHKAGNRPPNIKQLAKAVRPRLNARGLDASENHIQKIGNKDEFKSLRRPPGKTIANERK